MTNENGHAAHPVRNFFYILLSLLNLAAFLGFFYALATPALVHRQVICIVCGAWVVIALAFCLLRPLFRARG